MKTIKRNFIVEYKSQRRPTQQGPSSIWGNLDLKAIAAKVDSDVGDLSVALDDNMPTIAAPVSIARTSVETSDLLEPNLSTTNEPTADSICPDPAASPQTAAQNAQATNAQNVGPMGDVQKPVTKRRSRSQQKTAAADHEQIAVLQAAESIEDLETLARENEYLKGLLREKLIRDNAILRSLLLRLS